MTMERQINIYRFVFICAMVLLDGIGVIVTNNYNLLLDPILDITVVIVIVISGFVHLKANYAIKHNINFSKLPLMSVFGEIFLVLFLLRSIIIHDLDLPLSKEQLLTMMSIVIILLILLGSLRSIKVVITVEAIALTIALVISFHYLDSHTIIGYYLAGFVMMAGIFSLWVSDILVESYLANQQLNDKNEELENANEEITQQNEEISTQRDQLSEQSGQLIKQHAEVVNQKKGITDSIRYAYRIQEAIFPERNFLDSILPEYFIVNRPRDIVSGDFYWVQQYSNKTFIIVADSTGHGVPGAFMSMLGISLLNEIMRMYILMGKEGYITAGQILDELRDKVKKSLHQNGKANEAKDGMDMSLCIIDRQTNELQFAGANNPALIWRPNTEETFITLKPDRMPVSIYKKEVPFTNQHFQLEQGDVLYMQTDGVTDQFGGMIGQKLFMKRYKLKLEEIAHLPVLEQKSILENFIVEWMGEFEQVDDILIMGIRI